MTPAVILRGLSSIQLGDSQLPTTDGRSTGEAKRIQPTLGLEVPDRLSPNHVL